MGAPGRVGAPFSLAAKRLRARPWPALLTGLGLALAAGGIAVLLVSRVVGEDRAVADAVRQLPAEQRVISISWVGSSDAEMSDVDRAARRALRSLGFRSPVVGIAFRSTRLGTEVVRLAAVDRPEALLDARSGRLPERCAKATCQVVALDAPSRPLGHGFRVVGSATASRGGLLETLVGGTSTGERTLIASGIADLAARPRVGDLFRTLTWAAPLDPSTLDSESVASLPRRIAVVSTDLRVRSAGFDLRAPLQELAAARDRAQRASRHQLLVGGQSAALFLAFVLLAASRMGGTAREARRRLRRLGAMRWQIHAETAAHAGLIAIPAVVVGWIGGLALGAAIASAAGRPAGGAIGRSAAEPIGVVAVPVLALVAVIAIVGSVGTRSVRIRGLRITTLDVAAVGLLAVIAVTLAAEEPDGGPAGASLLLPILIAFAGALVTARLLGGALRLAERVARRGALALRLALLSLVRDPGPAVLTVVCLASTTGMAVFAASYRATWAANQQDTAAYSVPLDYVVTSDEARARTPATQTPIARHYDDFGAVGVVRRDAEAPSLNRTERLQVLGIPPSALPGLHWRDDYAAQAPRALAGLIAQPPTSLRGIGIPASARELILRRSLVGDPVRISAHLHRPDGGFSAVELRGASASSEVRAELPRALRGSTLVALTIGFPPEVAFTAAHRASGSSGAPDVLLRGTLTLGDASAKTATTTHPLDIDYRNWVRADGSRAGGDRKRLRFRYVLDQRSDFRMRPKQTTDGQVLPAIASASMAAAAGTAEVLPIRVAGAEIRVRLAGTARRFPTTVDDFLIVDRDALLTATNAASPGSALADEAWLSAPPGAERSLGDRAPFPVSILSRSALEARSRADPVARAAMTALLVGALLALALALIGLLFTVAADVRDRAAESFDLETLGLPPERLARHLWLRALVVLVIGLLGGLLTGAATILVVADGVSATANAVAAEPPLVPTVDWAPLAIGAALFVAFALGTAWLLAATAFRRPVPDRPEVA